MCPVRGAHPRISRAAHGTPVLSVVPSRELPGGSFHLSPKPLTRKPAGGSREKSAAQRCHRDSAALERVLPCRGVGTWGWGADGGGQEPQVLSPMGTQVPGLPPPPRGRGMRERIQRPSPSPPPSPSQPLSRGPGRGWECGGRGRSAQAGPQPWGAEGIPV